jgi:hypothetical protein
MKIVINRCYGGFGLSLKAKKRLMELKGKRIFFYKQTKYSYNDGKDEYTKINCLEESSFFTTASSKDLGEVIDKVPDKYYIWVEKKLERTDNDLIKVIEELGTEANGRCSNLRIVEIPDDIEYEIDDYDGMESIEEVHRSWC